MHFHPIFTPRKLNGLRFPTWLDTRLQGALTCPNHARHRRSFNVRKKTRHTLLKLRSCFLEDILMHIKRPKSSLHVPAPLTVWKICLLGSQIHHGHFHDRYRQKCLAKTLPTRYCSTSVDDPFWRNSYPSYLGIKFESRVNARPCSLEISY